MDLIQEKPGPISRILTKFRHRIFIQEVLTASHKTGIVLFPYYLVREGLPVSNPPGLKNDLSGMSFGYFGGQDMEAVSAVRERLYSAGELQARLAAGQKCLGIKLSGEIAAFTWFETGRCTSPVHSFSLEEDEAYLFDAFTARKFRGLGLAPYMRYRCYQELSRIGKVRLYSITAYFNTSSRRFKAKLGARPLSLNLYMGFLKRWNYRFKIREFKDRNGRTS